MCLCYSCANILKSRSRKCPICRDIVQGFIKLENCYKSSKRNVDGAQEKGPKPTDKILDELQWENSPNRSPDLTPIRGLADSDQKDNGPALVIDGDQLCEEEVISENKVETEFDDKGLLKDDLSFLGKDEEKTEEETMNTLVVGENEDTVKETGTES